MSTGNENEPAKLLLPFLQRADELHAHDPLVAYYCRLYAMERGLKIPQTERTKTTNALLVSLIKQLEKDKKSLELTPDDSLHIEGFALNVFAKADKQDRADRADKGTAKTFYAASIFFEILNQFGQLQPDLEQKQKYAAWKAADISKALKEGRKPVAGPPGVDNDLSSPSSSGYDPEKSKTDPAMKPEPEFEPSSRSHDKIDPQPSSNTTPLHPSNILQSTPSNIPPHTTNSFQSPTSHQPPSTDDYPSHNFHQRPPNDDYPSLQPPNLTGRSDNSTSTHPYQQPFPQEPQQHLPHYQSQDIPSHLYPNFQTYPSFTESSLPAAPSHHPSYYQGSETSYNITSASNASNFPITAQQSSNGRNGTFLDPAPTSVPEYQYDSNYQPPPEKIAEAHKAARFAVGALAFDDVAIAIDYLQKSLELLTNPSAGKEKVKDGSSFFTLVLGNHKSSRSQNFVGPRCLAVILCQHDYIELSSASKFTPCEEGILEVKASKLLSIDSLCLERSKLKADENDNNKQVDEDSSMLTRQSDVTREKKVSFRLPKVADIFWMDLADGYS